MPEDLAMNQLFATVERACAALLGLALLPLIYWWAIVGAGRGGNDCFDCDDKVVAAMGIWGVLAIVAALAGVGATWVVAATGNRRSWVWALTALAVAGLSIALQSALAPLR
jgi:hypothetical protein